ncbi:MAG: hypothetical protein IPL79_17315 [Myxococcales bacterium]|nr:hypothetical protein [Myxococcales bacterium]
MTAEIPSPYYVVAARSRCHRAWCVLLLVGCIVLPAAAHAGARRKASPVATALVKKHYPRSVAGRIAKALPALAASLIADPKAGDAITVYRGLSVAPQRFVATGVRGKASNHSENGEIWLSRNLRTAFAYTKRGRSAEGTILELKLPTRMWAPARYAAATENSWVQRTELPDLTPFISRIGVIGAGTRLKTVKWHTYDEAKRLGLFKSPRATR